MFIYVIGSFLGHKKIGYGKSPLSRLKQLQTGNPEPLEVLHMWEVSDKDARRIEKTSHIILSEHRLKGEWFDVDLDTAMMAVDRAIHPEKYQLLSEDMALARQREIDQEIADLDEEMNTLRGDVQSLKALLQVKTDSLLDGVSRRDALVRERNNLFTSK